MKNETTQAATHIPSLVDLSDNTTNVYAGPAQLVGVHVHTAITAQACPIEDGTGGTAFFNIPASTAAGTWLEAGNMRYTVGLFVNPDDAATGKITVVYTPIHDGLTGSGYSGG